MRSRKHSMKRSPERYTTIANSPGNAVKVCRSDHGGDKWQISLRSLGAFIIRLDVEGTVAAGMPRRVHHADVAFSELERVAVAEPQGVGPRHEMKLIDQHLAEGTVEVSLSETAAPRSLQSPVVLTFQFCF